MKKKNREFPISTLRTLLDYNPNTGELTWKHRPEVETEWWSLRGVRYFNSKFAGKLAGFTKKVKNRDYKRKELKLPDGRNYLAHRVIWAIMTGEWPEILVDHLDQNPINNRWNNLRSADYHENQQNVRLRSDNSSGLTGVCWNKRSQKWKVDTSFRGERKCVTVSNLLDAAAIRFQHMRELNFEQNHGKKKECNM